MTTLFTEHDLIRYIYGESSETQKTEIENAAVIDTDLQEEISSLKLNMNLLDKLSFNPSELALDRVFNYSLAYEANEREH